MRILTWNVNVLRTCLDYHPFSTMKKKNVEGLLDEMHAEIICFQEHKTRRTQLEKAMACPGPYDAFWTFNRNKTGYSGVCTYVDSRYCVPLKAEEGITGLLLGENGGTMKPPWSDEEKIGAYPDMNDMEWMDEVDGSAFEPRRLDMEGRAVVCDFGLFVLFNLYCPNETNETRRPYKMNFLKALQERVHRLMAAGRQVIIVGDINIMRAPIDSGDGGIRTTAEQHYQHPARRILDDWCAPKGPMIDVVRESWPDRDDMFTCWNTKLDARSANYGSRIDYVLCSPGLRPWIKGGDILSKVFGSDHCPVYIDLHESVDFGPERGVVHLRDLLNPPDRPPSTAPFYPSDPPRQAPEPPRFATKFFEEFSGKQQTLKNFFGGGGGRPVKKPEVKVPLVAASPEPEPLPVPPTGNTTDNVATPFGIARAAFDSIDTPASKPTGPLSEVEPGPSRRSVNSTPPIDLTVDAELSPSVRAVDKPRRESVATSRKPLKPSAGQTKLSSFFAQPSPPLPTSRAKRKTSPPPSATPPPSVRRRASSPTSPSFADPPEESTALSPQASIPAVSAEESELIAQAIAEADADKASKRARTNAQAAPKWNELFAKKLPPMCSVHNKPCRDYIVKIPGPNKGKRFWLCSLPVGAGYDSGRAKRAREDVNHNFRCDFFLWDSANSRKETPNGESRARVPT